MSKIRQPQTRKEANEMFISNFTFFNLRKSTNSTCDQSQFSELETFRSGNDANDRPAKKKELNISVISE